MPIFQEIHDNNYELEKQELYDAYKRLFANLIPTEKAVILNIKKKAKLKEPASPNSLFKPDINPNSAALAIKSRADGVNIEDKLIDQGKVVRNRIEEKQKERISKETEGCTFSPSINQRHKKEQV